MKQQIILQKINPFNKSKPEWQNLRKEFQTLDQDNFGPGQFWTWQFELEQCLSFGD